MSRESGLIQRSGQRVDQRVSGLRSFALSLAIAELPLAIRATPAITSIGCDGAPVKGAKDCQ
jgi:hypothetical protein